VISSSLISAPLPRGRRNPFTCPPWIATGSWRLTALLLGTVLCGCSAVTSLPGQFFGGTPGEGSPGYVSGFLGGVVADEPRAALAAREVLSTGGNAADAAVALGFALSVTLPSRAGLGGGGACLAYSPAKDSPSAGAPEAVLFVPPAPSAGPAVSDRPAAVPMLARGLFALHARYGRRPFESLIIPAEQMARFGVPASRAFVRDLQVVSGPLLADPNARAVFSRNGTPLSESDQLVQSDLGSTLAQIRVEGVGDFYQGTLALRIEQASALAGGRVLATELKAALPSIAPPLTLPNGRDYVSFLPPPADGGLAAAAAFTVLQKDPNALDAANVHALAVASRWRSGGGDPLALISAELPPGQLSPLPASTTFLTLDRQGDAVACAITMDNLFGTGRIAPGLGFLLASSPAVTPLPLLAAAITWNQNIHAFRAATGGSGQEGAALAAAVAMMNTLRSGQPMPVPVPEPGRANVIACSRYLPDAQRSCGWATDPRGFGLAIGSD
jgi:gamma-glutamyltranspeptidase / glutathione hydrolase